MKIKFSTSALQVALSVVGVVPPKPGGTTPPAFLFTPEANGFIVQSRDGNQEVRTFLAADEVEDGEAFLLPATYLEAIKLSGTHVVLETKEEQGTKLLSFKGERGNQSDRPLLDTMKVIPCTSKAGDKAQEIPLAPLIEALNQAKAFLPKLTDATVDEAFKSVLLVDDKAPGRKIGPGYVYAADGYRAFYFHCPAFEGKSFALQGTVLPVVVSFLSKLESNTVLVDQTARKLTFQSGASSITVPVSAKVHDKVSLYTKDTVTLMVPKEPLIEAVRYVRSDMDPKMVKIRVEYTVDPGFLTFVAVNGSQKASSFPVLAKPKDETEAPTEDRAFAVNVEHLMTLLSSCKGQAVELRLNYLNRDGQDLTMLRTVDEFTVTPEGKVAATGGSPCKVTRYVGSMG